ncbi:MAG: D-alanyl-D-alanine carboxypeptidase/D-alanyl-D-alanine-endopeptidase [Ignavibacteriae bacterium]|nr:D-alanyl-D-alanine carboxypeptidase/D-alanyl-D-alanine-endopeptidase [Ignavibacteriota bacterium]
MTLLLLLAVQCTGCSTAHETSRSIQPTAGTAHLLSSSPYPSIKKEIDALLADSMFPPSNIAIMVVSLQSDEVLYELNSRLLFNPASNQKLFTAAAALAFLGEDFGVRTVLSVDTTNGPRIFLRGFGDPLLTHHEVDSLAKALSALIPTGRHWKLSRDVSYFDSLYWGSGWAWDDEPDPTAMFISPLSVDNNAIRVTIRPGTAAGEQTEVATSPETKSVTIENAGQTVIDSVLNHVRASRRWLERTNTITVTGEMHPWDSATTKIVSMWQPERYTTALFAERLQAYGVQVEVDEPGPISATAFEAVSHTRRVDSIVAYMNRVSDNLSAENLLKILGAEQHGAPGSAGKGISVVKEFLGSQGFDTTRISIADGSGVSRYNLLSAESIISLLHIMYERREHFEAFYNSLAVSGETGSLSNRMKGTLAQGNLRGKTGTLTGASSLSGYVRTADGELLAFSILMQNFLGKVTAYRQLQDRICVFLSGLRRASL